MSALPYATPDLPGSGATLRASPEDFRVDEELGFVEAMDPDLADRAAVGIDPGPQPEQPRIERTRSRLAEQHLGFEGATAGHGSPSGPRQHRA